MNQLYYGDNLAVLRDHIAKESVDLIYLDPPFNSKRDYNLLFKSPKGVTSEAQIEAFEDTWHWNEQAEREFDELLHQPNTSVADMMRALRGFLGENDMMAYLTMMANRLLELHRVLKPTGSLYLHCDPTASHYLKIVLDGVFGKLMYKNEIIWQRTTAGKPIYRNLPKNTDVIFWYVKTDDYFFAPVMQPLTEGDKATFNLNDGDGRGAYNTQPIINPGDRPNLKYTYVDQLGRKWNPPTNGWRFNEQRMHELEADKRLLFGKTSFREKYYLNDREAKGKQLSNIWSDIPIPTGDERLPYPTQKPLALLERIIAASSNEGDVVLDPFCGCGTAVDAAQKLKRKWIGIDITHLAISLIEKRLKDRYKGRAKFEVHGTPKDLEAARDLALRDKYQFQWWAVSLVDAQPFQGKKKGADGGIDGVKFFRDLDRKEVRKIVVSGKSGKLKADDVRSLMAVRERESAEIALLISLDEPSKGMLADAASAGLYTSVNGKMKVPRVQLLTVAGLLAGTQRAEHPDYEPDLNFKKAKAEAHGEQRIFELPPQ
jgi:site-specific DNA-methyltransferase (adenine-specific)